MDWGVSTRRRTAQSGRARWQPDANTCEWEEVGEEGPASVTQRGPTWLTGRPLLVERTTAGVECLKWVGGWEEGRGCRQAEHRAQYVCFGRRRVESLGLSGEGSKEGRGCLRNTIFSLTSYSSATHSWTYTVSDLETPTQSYRYIHGIYHYLFSKDPIWICHRPLQMLSRALRLEEDPIYYINE